ncbi:MAG: hypothetical protein A3F17_01755 [Gammaproteobacteria bacterium RIFCSPHIGHO2_12_FULL_41_15]|nr:MAG: hypothetical protein A3F17_01755 [Gammaproteobacteria bacterium RIFCSPHIGHO2_12_FULL_41_15]
MSNYFDLTRFYRVIKIEILAQKKSLLVYMLIVFMVALLFPVHGYGMPDIGLLGFLLYTLGLIFTSTLFADIHSQSSSTNYLLLPCSNLERFLSRWLLSSFGMVLLIVLTYFISSILVALLYNVLLGFNVHPIHLLSMQLMPVIVDYMQLQSLFFLGAIIFKKNSALMTICCIAFFLFILFVLSPLFSINIDYALMLGQPLILLNPAMHFYFLFSYKWWVIMPLCLGVSYLKIAESES